MTMCGFLKGMAVGMVAGMAADMAINSKAMRKTEIGNALHKVGSAMDYLICDVSRAMR